MLKKTITYTDYNGVEHTEDFYFNLSKAELLEMEMSNTGGFESMLKELIDTKDNARIIEMFKDLILKSYGVKSADGKQFIKTKQLSLEFSYMDAYSVLYMELASDANASKLFVNGIIPKDLSQKAQQHAIAKE